MTADEQLAQLEQTTGIGAAEWSDLLTLPAADQEQAIADWLALGRMSWSQRPDVLAAVVAGLTLLGTIAGVVGGVAGAASAVAALRSL